MYYPHWPFFPGGISQHLTGHLILSAKKITEALITGNAFTLGVTAHFEPAVWQIGFCNEGPGETEKIHISSSAYPFNYVDGFISSSQK